MDELIKKAKEGDKDAFIQATLPISKDLYSIAYAKLNNIEDVNDVLQETLYKAFKNLRKLKDETKFKSWLMKILMNECNRFYCKQYQNIKLFEKIVQKETVEKASYNEFSKIEGEMDFDAIVSKLKYNERIIVILYFSNNFTTKEIADILNVNVNTVKSRLRAAENKIEKIMREGEI